VPGIKRTQTALYLRIYKIALPDLDLLNSKPELSKNMAVM
jgi:hypothetical protein